MAKNVCPGCKEVVLSFGPEDSIECSKCGTVIELNSSEDDSTCINADTRD